MLFEVSVPATNETLASGAACMIDVPVNKTSTAFTKAVDPIVGEMVKPLTGRRPSRGRPASRQR